MDHLQQDVRYALRAMRHAPVFTAAALVMLALGIGANTAIFALVNALMLRALPVRDPAQLVALASRYPGEPPNYGFAWKFYEGFRDRNHVFGALTGASPSRFQVIADRFSNDALDGEYVAGNFFQTLGVRPAAGRLIAPEDDRMGDARAAVAVLSWPFWNSAFNADPSIVGRRIAVNGVQTTIVGVAPREFFGVHVGTNPSVWLPAAMEPLVQRPSRRASGQLSLMVIGRLAPGVSLGQAEAEMRVLDRPRVEEIARTSGNAQWRRATIDVEPAASGVSLLKYYYGRPLLALMAAVVLLLLITCSNVASMLLARATARQREIAVRVALGAGRLRLMRQMTTESLLLAAFGAALGVALAYAGAAALVRIITSGRAPVGVPPQFTIAVPVDAHVLLFAIGAALVTGVLFGVAPAWMAFASASATALRDSAATTEPRSRQRFGRSLIAAQIALSVVLLSAAALFQAYLSNLRSVDLGFTSASVLLMTLNPEGSGYNRTQLTGRYRELLARIEAIPGVRSASVSAVTPIEGPGAARFARVEGFDERPDDRRYLNLNWIGPRYFETLGTAWIAGRDFEFDDANRSRVAIVNQAMARHYFGERSPIGKHITFDGENQPYEIVGVAGDAKYLSLHGTPPRTVYLNTFQEGRIFSQFSMRTSVPPAAVSPSVRRAVDDVLRTVRIARVTTMTAQMDASIVPERLVSMLSGLFGALGAALAAVGLYGLLAYSVARRTSEIGIRMALGATEGDVMRMVLTTALTLVCAGLVAGVPLALWLRRFASLVGDDVPLASTLPVAIAAALMLAVALAAAYLPARRAARVQPIEALRRS